MKSIKILLPAALFFTLFLGTSNAGAQSLAFNKSSNPIINVSKKTIGLDYRNTLSQIAQTLTSKIKTNRAINFQGKVIINLTIDAKGKISNVNFNKQLPKSLATTINNILVEGRFDPVRINGIPKTQLFSIPLKIK